MRRYVQNLSLVLHFNYPFVFHFFRSDYETFVRDLTRQFVQHFPSRIDSYMGSTIQVCIFQITEFFFLFFFNLLIAMPTSSVLSLHYVRQRRICLLNICWIFCLCNRSSTTSLSLSLTLYTAIITIISIILQV